MVVTIQCPHCGTRYPNIPVKHLGKRVRCKKCNSRFRALIAGSRNQQAKHSIQQLQEDKLLSTNTDEEPLRDILLRIETKLDKLLTAMTSVSPPEQEEINYDVPSEFGDLDI